MIHRASRNRGTIVLPFELIIIGAKSTAGAICCALRRLYVTCLTDFRGFSCCSGHPEDGWNRGVERR
jgi:hypothetical protein